MSLTTELFNSMNPASCLGMRCRSLMKPWPNSFVQMIWLTLFCTLFCINPLFSKALAAGEPTSNSTNIAEVNDDAQTPENTAPVMAAEFRNQGYQDPREEPSNEKHAFKTPFGQLVWNDIVDKIFIKDKRSMVNYKGYTLVLSISPELQASLAKSLATQRNIAGAMVMLESKTGRILAMAEKRGEGNSPLLADGSILVAARAPAASLMKIVTATAAIEKTGLEPEDDIPFFGGCGHLRNQNWLRDSSRDRQKLSFARAFGNSCNTVFARVALYWTGLASLRDYAEKYMFNKPIPSDLRLETSAALMPQLEAASALEVGEAGAGFGASKLSPIHAALLSAAAGNGGVMMAPYLVEQALDSTGKVVYTATPREISRVFSKKTSEKMLKLMQETVMSGTSRKFFRRRGTAKDRAEIGGKTGTLSDAEERATLYTWFSGIAPLDSPNNVAIGTLVSSPKNWVVRASSLAQMGLAQYLRLEKQDKRFASKTSY